MVGWWLNLTVKLIAIWASGNVWSPVSRTGHWSAWFKWYSFWDIQIPDIQIPMPIDWNWLRNFMIEWKGPWLKSSSISIEIPLNQPPNFSWCQLPQNWTVLEINQRITERPSRVRVATLYLAINQSISGSTVHNNDSLSNALQAASKDYTTVKLEAFFFPLTAQSSVICQNWNLCSSAMQSHEIMWRWNCLATSPCSSD